MKLVLLLFVATLANGCIFRARTHPHRHRPHRIEAAECVDCATLQAVPLEAVAAP